MRYGPQEDALETGWPTMEIKVGFRTRQQKGRVRPAAAGTAGFTRAKRSRRLPDGATRRAVPVREIVPGSDPHCRFR